MSDANNTRQYPLWKNAIRLAAETFSYGDIIPFDWLHAHFGIDKPETGGFKDFQDYQFDFLDSLDRFRRGILEEHNMAIDNVRGQGYRVVMPKEQTEYAEKKLHDDMVKNIRKAVGLITHIALDALDADDRRRNMDARGRVAALSAMMKNNRRISMKKSKEIAAG